MISLSNDKIDFKRLKEIINLLVKYNFENLVGEIKLKRLSLEWFIQQIQFGYRSQCHRT